MSTYSIKDLEQLSGIKAHTLRIWEQRYGIIDPQRTDSNIRTYDDYNLRLVLNISLLKDHGYKISEIAKLSPAEMSTEVLQIADKQLSYGDQVQALTLAMIDQDSDRVEKIIQNNAQRFGFENMMIHVLYPFLNRTGLFWMNGLSGLSQEQFITALVRQKIVDAIEAQLDESRSNGKKFLLFLPEGEYHELSLLFAHYLLRLHANVVIYLGQNQPMAALTAAYHQHKPDCMFTVLTSSLANYDVQPFVDRLANCYPNTQLLITGYQIIGQDIETPANVSIVNQINDLIRIAAS